MSRRDKPLEPGIHYKPLALQMLHALRDGRPHPIDELLEKLGKHIAPEKAIRRYASSRKRGMPTDGDELNKSVVLGKRSAFLQSVSHNKKAGYIDVVGNKIYAITPKGIERLIHEVPFWVELPEWTRPEVRAVFDMLCVRMEDIGYNANTHLYSGLTEALRVVHKAVQVFYHK